MKLFHSSSQFTSVVVVSNAENNSHKCSDFIELVPVYKPVQTNF